MRFSAILVRTSEETVAAIHRGSPVALPGFSTLTGRREEPVIPLHSLDTAMYLYAIRAYLLPPNHRKACRETKWMIRDGAPRANSKQICISIEAPLWWPRTAITRNPLKPNFLLNLSYIFFFCFIFYVFMSFCLFVFVFFFFLMVTIGQ